MIISIFIIKLKFILESSFFNILKAQDNKNKVEETHEEQGEMTQEEKDEIYSEFVDYDLNKDGMICFFYFFK
ncbi:hypothetical protein PFFCH_01013 [Plasmodium falciparum FCH/4]|uniref:EF-hand domain-containing protein n=1 Tax=Plasmodium falciparum FCH/4 TaxID=1036724 RepID=A0A024VS13_PLAFA|nr:hypothetical protein PFFCH_01013 [Plasmodium falciparum FCH/4]